MRIAERLKQDGPCFSFEFFPPKTEEGATRLWSVLRELKALDPSFVSVTYGAGGSTRAKTLDLTTRIKKELGLEAMAHLTCVGATKGEIEGVLQALQDGGVDNILPLRGDPPKGQSSFEAVEGGFRYASELTQFIRERFPFCMAGACYPEGHVEATSPEADLDHLKRKVDAGAEFLVTQLFFDNRLYFDFVDRAIGKGISVPIVPGIMPIQGYAQVKRFTQMCGASIPEGLMEALEARKDDPERVQKLGVVHATIQCLGLIHGGAPGIHFYTLNKSDATREILTAMRLSTRL